MKIAAVSPSTEIIPFRTPATVNIYVSFNSTLPSSTNVLGGLFRSP